VHALLVHLADVGFDGAPRSLGIDDRGRHVVEWIEGETTHPYRSTSSSPTLREIGRIMRRFHDVTAQFVPPDDAAWQQLFSPDSSDLVVHNDLAAWNFVHGRGRAVFVDWDFAAPGSRLWDLAWAAVSFAELLPETPIEHSGNRLRSMVDGYGLDDDERCRLVGLIAARCQAQFDLLADGDRRSIEPWATHWRTGHGTAWQAITEHNRRHADALTTMLLR
jgi:Phosphotransferase enzyme family